MPYRKQHCIKYAYVNILLFSWENGFKMPKA